MTTSQQLSLWADSIRDMSATGLKHSKSTYDTDRYQALQTMSMQMMAAAILTFFETFACLRRWWCCDR